MARKPPVLHLWDPKKLHGVACNHVKRTHNLWSTSDRSAVTCRGCLAASTLLRYDGPGA